MPLYPRKDDSDVWRASTLGLELVGAILAGAGLGWLIDRWLDSEPVGVLIGLVVGVIGGGFAFVRDAMKMNRRAAAEYRRRRAPSGPAQTQAPAPPLTGPDKPSGQYRDTRALFERDMPPDEEDQTQDVRFPDDLDKW